MTKTLAAADGAADDKGKQRVDDFTVAGVVRPLIGPCPITLRRRAAMPLELLGSQLQQLRLERGECSYKSPKAESKAAAAAADLEDTAAVLERLTLLTGALEQRRMNKIRDSWLKKQIAFAIAFNNVLILLIQFRTSLPPRYLNHVAGVFAVLWIIGSINFFRGLFVMSGVGFRCRVAQLIYIFFALFVVYALYLISQPVGGTLINRLAWQELTEMQTLTLHPFRLARLAAELVDTDMSFARAV